MPLTAASLGNTASTTLVGKSYELQLVKSPRRRIVNNHRSLCTGVEGYQSAIVYPTHLDRRRQPLALDWGSWTALVGYANNGLRSTSTKWTSSSESWTKGRYHMIPCQCSKSLQFPHCHERVPKTGFEALACPVRQQPGQHYRRRRMIDG